MTREDVLTLARQAWAETGEGWVAPGWFDDRAKSFARFAELVEAAEREACAVASWSAGMDAYNAALGMPCDARQVGSKAAQAIRARGQK